MLDILELAELVLVLHSVEVTVCDFDIIGVLDVEDDALGVFDALGVTVPVVDNDDVFDTDIDRDPDVDDVELFEGIGDRVNVDDDETVADRLLEGETENVVTVLLDIAADFVEDLD